jgi:hypothetical protein
MSSWFELTDDTAGLFDLDFTQAPTIGFENVEDFIAAQSTETGDNIEALTVALEMVWATPYFDYRVPGTMPLAFNENTKVYLSGSSLSNFALETTIMKEDPTQFFNPIIATLPKFGVRPYQTPATDTFFDNGPYEVLSNPVKYDLSMGFSYTNAMLFSGTTAFAYNDDDFVNAQGVALGYGARFPEYQIECQDGSINSGNYELLWSGLPDAFHGCPDNNLSFNLNLNSLQNNSSSIVFEPGQSEEYLPGIRMQLWEDEAFAHGSSVYPTTGGLTLELSGSYTTYDYVRNYVNMQIDRVALRLNHKNSNQKDGDQQDWQYVDWYFNQDRWAADLPQVEEDSVVDIRIEYTSGESKQLQQTINRAFILLAGNPPQEDISNSPNDDADQNTSLDTDGDGMTDEWELANGLDPNNADDVMSDHDNDGLVAIDGMIMGTQANVADSDGDGIFDGAEILRGSDPVDVLSVPRELAAINDFDGDGIADLVYYDATNNSAQIETAQLINTVFIPNENNHQMLPVNGDFDGDGVADLSFHLPNQQRFMSYHSSDNVWHTTELGGHSQLSADPADYDGDGITDYAVFDDSAREWTILMSSNGEVVVRQVAD